MEILQQLGANGTAFIQFLLFIIAITFLTTVVFGPYYKAYDIRQKLTKGADQVANETQDEVKKLTQIYSARAREINEKINTVFSDSKQDGLKSTSIILDAAKAQVTQTSDSARKEIATQKQNASGQIQTIAKDVSDSIIQKMTGAQ